MFTCVLNVSDDLLMIIVMKVIDVSEYVVGFQISVKTEDFSESLCREALLLG